MEKAKILRLVLFLVLLMSSPSVLGMPGLSGVPAAPYVPRPLCQSQFILVNYACATLPYNPAPPISPPGEESPPSQESPNSPDSPAESPSPGGPSSGSRASRHRRHRAHHRQHTETPVEAECCRWLKAVDTECVCDLLVHLPTFLSRPLHQYAVTIHEECSVTFSCSSRIQI